MRRVTLAASLLLVSTAAALACGTERWAVKTGTDQDAAQVIPTAQAVTIAALGAIPAPADPNAQPTSRFAPTGADGLRDLRHLDGHQG